MASKFVHLHLHTEYSLLDGLSKIDHLIRYIKENDMDSVAITDHGAMYGEIEFYKKCTKEGIKPILGMEAYMTNVDLKLRPERSKFTNFHLLLLAANEEGYKNLMKLSSIAHLDGYYYRPRIDHQTLEKYSKGLICTSACPQGELAQALIADNFEESKKIAQWHVDTFGENYYLEIQRHSYDTFAAQTNIAQIKTELMGMSETEKKVNEGVMKISRELGIPVLCTNDAHYIKKEDATAQDSLVCIATGKNVTDLKRLRFIDAPDYYVKSPDEMYSIFSDMPEVVSETVKVAEKCNVSITLGKWFFPECSVPDNMEAPEYLRKLANERLRIKFDPVTEEAQNRLDYELDIIIKKGYAPYFLIVMGLANWAYSVGIVTNTRGSAAGSLVSFCLGITTVDPLYYNLPFERFLNPYRPSPPDIDFDVADDKRDQVIKYIADTYGVEKVAQICTFGRMLARGSVRDVARVLGYPYSKGDEISKMIPLGAQGFPMTIEKALGVSPQLAEMYNSDTDAKKILDLAKQVEGNARHLSVHAAGVVVAPTEITDFSPVQHEPSGDKVITQYEMHACEDVGLIKFDILGIRNLSFLGASVELVKKTKNITVDLTKIPLNDTKTFEMLSRGETMGVFQLAGGGMTKYIKELKPNRVEDLMAMVALYRPGPISVIPDYIERKKNPKLVKYLDPRMKKFLDKSYGLIVYQDDLLFCAIDLAGYTWEEADKFRKAVGKKIPEEMAAQKKKFIDGTIANGQTQEFADNLWKLFEPFQSYGFNKAHAASYGMVAYQTGYMKANFPVEYLTALLTAESGDVEKVTAAINECRRMHIKVLPPNINYSDTSFTVVDDPSSMGGQAILFGLNAIKNVGEAAISAILQCRADGKFSSFENFCFRVDNRKVNKKVFESLIKVGALSDFGPRKYLLSVMDSIRDRAKPKVADGQANLFGDTETSIEVTEVSTNIPENAEEFSDDEKERYERELLGFSLSAKPVVLIIEHIAAFATHKVSELKEIENPEGLNVKLATVISEVRVITTKKSGDEMAFVKLEDETGTIDGVVFPKLYQASKEILNDHKPVLVSGRVSVRDNQISIVIEKMSEDGNQDTQDDVLIKVPKSADTKDLQALKALLVASPGSQKVNLYFEETKKNITLQLKVTWNSDLAHKVSTVFTHTA